MQPAIPTVGGDTILRIPRQGDNDPQLIVEISRKIASAYRETETLPDAERRAAVEARLASLNQGAIEEINPNRGKIFEFKTVA